MKVYTNKSITNTCYVSKEQKHNTYNILKWLFSDLSFRSYSIVKFMFHTSDEYPVLSGDFQGSH